MIETIAALIIIVGSVFILLSAIGIIRMPDLYTRMSATTKASTLGAGLILIGTALFFKDVGIATRAISIIFFLILTAPVAAHIIGRAAYFDGVPLWKNTHTDELKGKYDMKDHTLSGIDEDK